MNCCTLCFLSEYVRNIISRNSTNIGICDFCDSKNVNLYDPRELVYQFKHLISLYIPAQEGVSSRTSNVDKLENQILEDFPNQIFNDLSPVAIKTLLTRMFDNEREYIEEILDINFHLEFKNNPSSIKKAEIFKVSWDEFSKEIQTENRFHLNNILDLEKLEELLKRYEKKYLKGNIFFRGRISDRDGFDKSQMKNPPSNKAGAGRANPEGISYLYLANNVETTIYETRANLYDYITIGEIRLKNHINVVNLHHTYNFDPILLSENEVLDDFMIHLPFISQLEDVLSKPLRRSDKKLDYIPTQYLSEFIKSLNYDGIEYKSSLNTEGYNLAIFNPDNFDCINTFVKEIHNINYEHRDTL